MKSISISALNLSLAVSYFSQFFTKIQAHGGGAHDHSNSFLNAKSEITDHDIEHLKGTLQLKKPIKDMTKEEKQFYYFKQADTDNDDRLDGLEILATMIRFEEEDAEYSNTVPEIRSDDEWAEMLDRALVGQDIDDDGFVSFWEFQAKRRGLDIWEI